MPDELKAELSIVKMRLIQQTVSPPQAGIVRAFATTKIPGEVRAKYLRDRGISIVWADVYVDATGDSPFELHAVVHVKLTYQGDMVRSSEHTREKINQRLEELAQKYCAEMTCKEIIWTTKQ